jgi:hypothetical protein
MFGSEAAKRVPLPAVARRMIAAVICVACQCAFAEQVICRYTYGGESRELVAAPVASPYKVPAIQVGSYFKFRVVFQKTPRDLASIKVYVYGDRDDDAVPLHEAVYPYPPPAAPGARHGFTGLHFVYEPMRDGELEYWCRMSGGRAPR